jgi:putative membrane protein (TIGR04086 family)
MARDVVVRPSGTSWGAVLDGWLATVGVAAILSPIVSLMLANWYPTRGYASTVPILVAVGLSYLVGGYVAGRMAGYRTSWHGMMVAFFGLFVALALLVVDIAYSTGVFGGTARLIQVLPVVLGVSAYESIETFAFGGALGILLAVFAGWLGGLLAPSRIGAAARVSATPVVEERQVTTTEVRRPRERFRLLPSAGHKGGERVDKVDEVTHP